MTATKNQIQEKAKQEYSSKNFGISRVVNVALRVNKSQITPAQFLAIQTTTFMTTSRDTVQWNA